MKKVVKILTLILALIMCISCFAACGEEDGDSASTTDANETTATAETTAADETTIGGENGSDNGDENGENGETEHIHNYVNGACTGCGEKKPSEGLKFALNDDDESYYVFGIGTCTDTEIIIPSSYNGKPVTGIGQKAFDNCQSFTRVTIPEGVEKIGAFAFASCDALTRVTMPSSLTDIDAYAFTKCNLLVDISIPNGVERIGYGAFEDCRSLDIVSIPNSISSIEGNAFTMSTSLSTINYDGTMAQWGAIEKGLYWNANIVHYVIHCTDGDISGGLI